MIYKYIQSLSMLSGFQMVGSDDHDRHGMIGPGRPGRHHRHRSLAVTAVVLLTWNLSPTFCTLPLQVTSWSRDARSHKQIWPPPLFVDKRNFSTNLDEMSSHISLLVLMLAVTFMMASSFVLSTHYPGVKRLKHAPLTLRKAISNAFRMKVSEVTSSSELDSIVSAAGNTLPRWLKWNSFSSFWETRCWIWHQNAQELGL